MVMNCCLICGMQKFYTLNPITNIICWISNCLSYLFSELHCSFPCNEWAIVKGKFAIGPTERLLWLWILSRILNVCSSVNEDGEILRSLLNNQVEYDSMQSKVSDALQSVPDPDKLVLDAINGIYPSNLKALSWVFLDTSFYCWNN